jgi:hypothetical protein
MFDHPLIIAGQERRAGTAGGNRAWMPWSRRSAAVGCWLRHHRQRTSRVSVFWRGAALADDIVLCLQPRAEGDSAETICRWTARPETAFKITLPHWQRLAEAIVLVSKTKPAVKFLAG